MHSKESESQKIRMTAAGSRSAETQEIKWSPLGPRLLANGLILGSSSSKLFPAR